tara:strand:- start:61 stop:507 length:447 start_codon:yes stop_codon:yes gene_type:complete
MKRLLVLHGPNLNLLGARETNLYGQTTLAEINAQLENQACNNHYQLTTKQSNSEAELINALHQAHEDKIDYIIFNPAAFTHTSIALRDALLAVKIPFIEVHISNIFTRESFRHYSYFSDIAQGVISGLGTNGYLLAFNAIVQEFKRES